MLSTRLLTRSTLTSVPRFISANPARTFAISAIAMGKLSDVIIHDHQELREMYDKILSASDADTKTRWQNQFTWELARHSIGEELVVYPVFEKNLPDGEMMAQKDRDQHNEIKEKLYKFQSMKADDPEFEPTLKSLWEPLHEHIKEEEKDDLPAIEKTLQGSESDELAASFQRTKKFVPTRSHPSAPDKPPFETVAGLMAAPLDKLGDLFRKFPKE